MDVRIVGVPVIDRDPIEARPEIALHLGHEVAGERLEVGHFSGILRRDDEAEVMPIVMAAAREGRRIEPVLRGAEHVGFLAAARDTVTFEVGNVGRQGRRASGTAGVPDYAGLHDNAAVTGKKPVAGKCQVASPEC
jgi:hypothetical protein